MHLTLLLENEVGDRALPTITEYQLTHRPTWLVVVVRTTVLRDEFEHAQGIGEVAERVDGKRVDLTRRVLVDDDGEHLFPQPPSNSRANVLPGDAIGVGSGL